MIVTNLDLSHAGVKGMKWGVRKKEEPSQAPKKKLTKTQKKIIRNVAIGAAFALTLYVASDTSTKHLDKVQRLIKDSRSVVVPAGARMQNINLFGPELKTNKSIFTTHTSKDKIDHGRKFVNELYNRSPKTVYNTVLSAKQDIKAPSNRTAEKLYKEFLKTQPATKVNRTYSRFHSDIAYNGFQLGKNSPFFDFLKERGYNAIQDIVDQRSSHYKAQKPLIIFDGASTLTTIGEYVMRYGPGQLALTS